MSPDYQVWEAFLPTVVGRWVACLYNVRIALDHGIYMEGLLHNLWYKKLEIRYESEQPSVRFSFILANRIHQDLSLTIF